MSYREGKRGNPEKMREIEKLPGRINVQFFFGSHGSSEDAEALKPFFEKCDIFIPEAMGWTMDHFSAKNDLARGTISLDDYKGYQQRAIEGGATNEGTVKGYEDIINELIVNSGKFICFIDAPEGFPDKGNPVEANLSDTILDRGPRESLVAFTDGKWDKAMETLRKAFEESAAFHRQREKHIVSNFKKKFTDPEWLKALMKVRELQGKTELNVLIQLGAIHTGVFHELKQLETDPSTDTKAKFQITRSMNVPGSSLFSLTHTNLRSFLFEKSGSEDGTKIQKSALVEWFETFALRFFSQKEKEPQKGDELLAQYLLQACLQMTRSHLNKISNTFSFDDQNELFWYLCHSLSLEEIKDISTRTANRVRALPQKDQTLRVSVDTTIEEIKMKVTAKGIPFLDTPEGAKELLRRAKTQMKRFPGRTT